MLLRIVRAALAFEGGASIGLLPGSCMPSGTDMCLRASSTVTGSITSAPAPCVGLSFDCRPQRSDGTFFSVLCHDELPFVDRDALTSSAVGDPAAQEDFVASPYFDVCDAWDVGSADPSAAQPVSIRHPHALHRGTVRSLQRVPEIRSRIPDVPERPRDRHALANDQPERLVGMSSLDQNRVVGRPDVATRHTMLRADPTDPVRGRDMSEDGDRPSLGRTR